MTKQSKSLEKITTLLEKLNGSMEALVEVERRKSSLVAQMRGGSAPGTGGRIDQYPQLLDQLLDQPVDPQFRLLRLRRQQWQLESRKRHWVRVWFLPPQTPNVQPKLMPTSLTPPAPSAFPPAPVFTASACVWIWAGKCPRYQVPSWKRVRLADGNWAWAEADQGDI